MALRKLGKKIICLLIIFAILIIFNGFDDPMFIILFFLMLLNAFTNASQTSFTFTKSLV